MHVCLQREASSPIHANPTVRITQTPGSEVFPLEGRRETVIPVFLGVILDPRFFPLPPPMRNITHSKSIMGLGHFTNEEPMEWA